MAKQLSTPFSPPKRQISNFLSLSFESALLAFFFYVSLCPKQTFMNSDSVCAQVEASCWLRNCFFFFFFTPYPHPILVVIQLQSHYLNFIPGTQHKLWDVYTLSHRQSWMDTSRLTPKERKTFYLHLQTEIMASFKNTCTLKLWIAIWAVLSRRREWQKCIIQK